MKFVITGATGHLGKLVVSRLLEQVPSSDIGISVRDPEKAAALLEKGVRVRHGDFAAPETLLGAFDQSEKLLIVSPNVVGEKAIQQHRAAINAATKVGAKHLFYTSHMGASSTSAFPPMISHAAAESYLQGSGVPFTALRNGFYAESMMMYLQEALQTGELNLPEDGPVAWTTHEDLAEATAKLMVSGSSLKTAMKLTSPEVLNFKDIASLVSDITGKSIIRTTIPDAKFQEKLEARGVPSFAIPIAMGLFVASRSGEFSDADSTLEQILDRKSVSVREFLAQKLRSSKD